MDMPADWNGTVLLFSHGYRPAGSPIPPRTPPTTRRRRCSLTQGYALIGSSYATTGWARDGRGTRPARHPRRLHRRASGEARRTIAWGQSLRRIVTTAIAERHPGRIDGSLAMCGLVHGGVANWNNTLDPVFALKTLLAPGSAVPLTGFADQASAAAAADDDGRDRHRGPGHARGPRPYRPRRRTAQHPRLERPRRSREPAPDDWNTAAGQPVPGRSRGCCSLPAFSWRQEAESRAGGNMSWNTGVDYAEMLRRSSVYKEVTELYKDAPGCP